AETWAHGGAEARASGPPCAMAAKRSVRDDRPARDVAVFLVSERLVDLLQREPVRQDLVVLVLRLGADHQIQCALEVLGLVINDRSPARPLVAARPQQTSKS